MLTTIQDANGKEISVDFSKIADINGDVGPDSTVSSAMDSLKNRVTQVHDIEVVDSDGQVLDREQLLKDIKSGKSRISALDVEMEATHSGPNHNYCVYYEDSMEKDCESFTNPFKKPVLKNHDSSAGEPMGRIQRAWYGPSALTDERSAIHLSARITDQDVFPKFLDGRYSTVSISGTMGTVTCNICGKTILKDGKFKFCGHWRGESYKDQVCYWGAKDIEYHEVSTVNSPADDFAQIMKVTVVTDSKQKKEGADMDGQPNERVTQASADDLKKSVCDMIDQLLNNAATSNSDTNTGTKEVEAAQDNEPQDKAQAEDKTSEELDTKIKDMEAKLNDATQQIEEKEKELQKANDELNSLKSKLEEAQTEAANLKDMCLNLASANKNMVIDQILAREKANNVLAEDKIEERKNELLAQSMKELNKTLSDANAPVTPRSPVSVPNPGLADRSKDTDGNVADGEPVNKPETKRTVDDFAKDIVGKLFK